MPVVLGLVGVIVGSFLNVVIHRVPLRRSIVRPASACPRCAQPITARDNIPLLSWLLLRGRCRHCAEPISSRYPLVELGTALAFGLVAWWATATGTITFEAAGARALASSIAGLAALLFLAAVSIVLAAIDLDTHTLPNRIVLPALGVAAALIAASTLLAGAPAALGRAGLGMLALGALYAVIAFAYPGGMGFGDVKLALLLGLCLGWFSWGALIVGAFAAFLLGALWGIGLIVSRRGGRKTSMPFGPWMLVGAWVGLTLGERVMSAYLALAGLT